MKKLLPWIVLAVAFFGVEYAIYAGTPNYTAPQEQASALAVPQPASEPDPMNVVVIVLCNNVVGLFVTDTSGEVHMYPFKDKDDVSNIQRFVDGAHNKSINLGCPGTPMKDTPVI